MARQPSVDERREHLSNFVGREDVVGAIDAALDQGKSWVLVRGAPGLGKSALFIYYLERLETVGVVGPLDETINRVFGRSRSPSDEKPIGRLAARLFTKRQQNRRIVPHAFLHRTATKRERSRDVALLLARQIEALFPEFANPEAAEASWYLHDLLTRASTQLVPAGQRLVLVIDGIDQCADDLQPPNPFSFRLPVVPEGVSVLCSSRSLPSEDLAWMSASGSFSCIDLDETEWAESNRDVCFRIAEKIQPILPPHIDVERAVAAAGGSARYLVDLAHTLQEHPVAPLERLPHHFRGYLDEIWDRLQALPDDVRSIVRSGLEVLATQPDAVASKDLITQAGWEAPRALETFVRLARPFVVEQPDAADPKWRLFHPGFAKYIEETLIVERSLPFARQRGPRERVNRALPDLTRTPSRYFLGIGADDYVEDQLRLGYCSNDARALAALLKENGYSVAALHDQSDDRALRPTMFNIKAALEAMRNRFDPDEMLWVHFSCHGVLYRGKPYLLATDSRSPNPAETALALENVVRAIKASGTKRWLLTLDACHAGVDTGRDATPERLDEAFIRNVNELAEAGAIIAASTAAQKAGDSHEAKHGVFTMALLEALKGPADRAKKGFITVDDLKDEVIDRVRRWTFEHLGHGEPQTPSFRVEGTGDLIVVDRRVASI